MTFLRLKTCKTTQWCRTLALAASYLRRTRHSVLRTDRDSGLRIHSNQIKLKQNATNKHEQASTNMTIQKLWKLSLWIVPPISAWSMLESDEFSDHWMAGNPWYVTWTHGGGFGKVERDSEMIQIMWGCCPGRAHWPMASDAQNPSPEKRYSNKNSDKS